MKMLMIGTVLVLCGVLSVVGFAVGSPAARDGADPQQDTGFAVDGGSRTPRRRGDDAPKIVVPQLDFECLPTTVGFTNKDLVVTCDAPLVIEGEEIDTFTVRHKIRFAPIAASVITSAVALGEPLLITVDQTMVPHGRCRSGCRRINQVELVAPSR